MTAIMTDLVTLDDPPVDVRLRVNTRARRFTLRLDPQGDGAVLTLPPGVPLSEARMFLLRQADWLTGALAQRPGTVAVGDGAWLPVAGEEVRVRATPGPRRAPKVAGDELLIQGPGAAGPRIAAFLKSRARDTLVPAAKSYAARLGRQVKGVSLRDTRSRWGSCSTAGRLSFSWRLAMAPPEVLDYVAAHEAAHLSEMNHSERFWSLVADLMPDYQRHRDWLRREGRHLHRYRFDG